MTVCICACERFIQLIALVSCCDKLQHCMPADDIETVVVIISIIYYYYILLPPVFKYPMS